MYIYILALTGLEEHVELEVVTMNNCNLLSCEIFYECKPMLVCMKRYCMKMELPVHSYVITYIAIKVVL